MFYDPQLRPALVAAIDKLTTQAKRSADSLDGIETASNRSVEAIEFIAETLDKIYKKLARITKPDPPTLVITSENGLMLNFKITPDWATADADVVSAEVSVTVDGGSPIVVTVARGGDAEDPGFAGPDGATVRVSCSYFDDATPTPNKSPQTDKSYTLADTIAPAAPGEPVLTVTSET